MTIYEILDLRREHISDVGNYYKFWISMTFAIIVAAHVAGPDMGIAGVVLAIGLYLVFSATNLLTSIRTFNVIEALNQDIAQLRAELPDPPTVLTAIKNSAHMSKVVVAVQTLGAAVATGYVILRSGFVG